MKIEFNPSELLSVITIGVIGGLQANATNQKWHRLGRDAYLAYHSGYFDKHMASPSPLIILIIAFAVVALLGFALYKGLVFVYSKILSTLPRKSDTAQG
jgi:H+/Cl- antiporter ClcA